MPRCRGQERPYIAVRRVPEQACHRPSPSPLTSTTSCCCSGSRSSWQARWRRLAHIPTHRRERGASRHGGAAGERWRAAPAAGEALARSGLLPAAPSMSLASAAGRHPALAKRRAGGTLSAGPRGDTTRSRIGGSEECGSTEAAEGQEGAAAAPACRARRTGEPHTFALLLLSPAQQKQAPSWLIT